MRIRSVQAIVACVAAAVLAASCTPGPKKSGPTPFDKTVVQDCYTVDLFTVANIEEPDANVPSDWAKYSGEWGKAAWDGKWCHDLLVTKIHEDGAVDVLELHAPYEPWGKPATAFRRKGRITKDGRLRISYSGVSVEYWIENGRLYGLRREGGGEMRIALSPGKNAGLGA